MTMSARCRPRHRSLGIFLFMKPASSSLQLLFSSRRRISMKMMSSTSNSRQGRIWTHRPFQVTPSSTTTTTNPSISNCPLPTKTPTPPFENRIHVVYQSAGPVALEQLCQSKQEFYKTQFSSRVVTEDVDRIRKRKLASSSSSSREVNVTIYLPKSDPNNTKLNGICLHVHGGGWIWGDSQYQVAHRCLEMTESMNVAVVSVEYSLASTVCNDNGQIFDPVNEVVTALDWIENIGADELNTKPVYVASGESSGAQLLLLSMLKRRDRADGMPSLTSTWKCLNLVYGFYDISGTPSMREDGNDSSPICGNELICMADMYCDKILHGGNHDEQCKKKIDRQHPSISPMYANLSNLPPALISVGTADPLLDDSLFLASRYSICGNDVETVLYEGGEHGIGHFGLQEEDEMGRRAREYTLQFMKRYLEEHIC
ncbi:alpha/beta hydrolase family protein [Skeletonema marinoi]|uniref:Alpha/beta hydrolase family protein n=1 Tax=Skeletonema marinoi TaxID=267567 RepID=A0AAD9D3N5_9STRA|nr:alpha/beta hydrolase family protein [Skeletonema marinoi]